MFGLIFPCAIAVVDQVSDAGGLVELESEFFLEVERGQLPLWVSEGDSVRFSVRNDAALPRRFWRIRWPSTRFNWGRCGPRNPGVLYEFEMSSS